MSEHLGDWISALLDGELADADRASAERHLATCAECTAVYDGIASVRTTVRSLPLLDPPFGLIERMVLPGGAEETTRKRRRPPVWLAGAAAAVSLIVLAAAPRHPHSVQAPVATFVNAHAASAPGADPVSGMAPVAVPVSFHAP